MPVGDRPRPGEESGSCRLCARETQSVPQVGNECGARHFGLALHVGNLKRPPSVNTLGGPFCPHFPPQARPFF